MLALLQKQGKQKLTNNKAKKGKPGKEQGKQRKKKRQIKKERKKER